jgi:hypothetical protein
MACNTALMTKRVGGEGGASFYGKVIVEEIVLLRIW